MQVTNAIMPEGDAIKALLEQGYEGPVRMVNLLKFRDKAAYPDGRDSELSGMEAYLRYGVKAAEIVESNGGKMAAMGPIAGLVIGQVEEMWDYFALVEYPSLAEFVRIVSLPEVMEISEHRSAGLAGQLLIPVKAVDGL